MRQLGGITKFDDPQCVEQFRTGFEVADMLGNTGHYAAKCTPAEISMRELLLVRGTRNREIIGKLKMDAKADVLLKKTHEDAQLHRMSTPRPLKQEDLDSMCLSPRFAVLQGRRLALRVTGVLVTPSLLAGPKVRPCDDFTRSWVNAATGTQEKLQCDTLDDFFWVMREAASRFKACGV